MISAETPATLERARAERPVILAGPAGPLYGIFTPPAPEVPSAERCVVFPGRPRFIPRRGPVLAARALAAQGFACLRFDLRDAGESAGSAASRDEPCGADVAAAIRHARETWRQNRFILIGHCLAALAALEAFCEAADAIDGLFFASAPVTGEKLAAAGVNRTQETAPLLRVLRRWTASARADKSSAPALSRGFEAGFEALVRSQARALFIYWQQDALRKEFEFAQRRLFRNLSDETRRRLSVEIWPGSEHMSQDAPALFERAVSWARGFHPIPGAAGAAADGGSPSDGLA